jgi:hypothetical protein
MHPQWESTISTSWASTSRHTKQILNCALLRGGSRVCSPSGPWLRADAPKNAVLRPEIRRTPGPDALRQAEGPVCPGSCESLRTSRTLCVRRPRPACVRVILVHLVQSRQRIHPRGTQPCMNALDARRMPRQSSQPRQRRARVHACSLVSDGATLRAWLQRRFRARKGLAALASADRLAESTSRRELCSALFCMTSEAEAPAHNLPAVPERPLRMTRSSKWRARKGR